jgi:hypothetical protein
MGSGLHLIEFNGIKLSQRNAKIQVYYLWKKEVFWFLVLLLTVFFSPFVLSFCHFVWDFPAQRPKGTISHCHLAILTVYGIKCIQSFWHHRALTISGI